MSHHVGESLGHTNVLKQAQNFTKMVKEQMNGINREHPNETKVSISVFRFLQNDMEWRGREWADQTSDPVF